MIGVMSYGLDESRSLIGYGVEGICEVETVFFFEPNPRSPPQVHFPYNPKLTLVLKPENLIRARIDREVKTSNEQVC